MKKKASLTVLAVFSVVSLALGVITNSWPMRVTFWPVAHACDTELSHFFEPGGTQVLAEAGLLTIIHCGVESEEPVMTRQIEAGLFFWLTHDCGYGSRHLRKTSFSLPLSFLAVGPWVMILLGRMFGRPLKLPRVSAAEKVFHVPSTAQSKNVACTGEPDAESDSKCGVRLSVERPGQRTNVMQTSVIILTIAVSTLAALQFVPQSLHVSIAQIGVTGALLIWFVGFALKRA